MRYIPHTAEDVRQMLEAIGVDSTEDLFGGIPAAQRLGRPLDLPEPLSESELIRALGRLASCNATVGSHISFLGGGAYNHFIPAVIDHIVGRSEFYTAYTPYQPEISQGTLQAIFEYQSLICQITGMEVANASMYDGASACAEAVLMAARSTSRGKILLSAALHPEYRSVVESYCRYLHLEPVEIPTDDSGGTDRGALSAALGEDVAAVVVGYPNFFGVIEELSAICDAAHQVGAKAVVAVQEPIALGLLKSPGELGADIVVGEGQSFGIPLSYGGPYLGFFAARGKDVRSMPGRLVGETVDLEGRRGYVLTLATREQHIRREKATSNICSNQGLCALMATVYLCLMGKEGIREVAGQNLSKAEYAKERIGRLPNFSIPFSGRTFNEFVVDTVEETDEVMERLEERGILGGIPLSQFFDDMAGRFLVCVTEQNSVAEIDALVAALAGGGR